MDWQTRMREEETRLKKLVDRLATVKGGGLLTLIERKLIIRTLDRKLEDANSFMEDCLTGRNSYEKYLMEYQVRMQFPLFSHLTSLFAMTPRVFMDGNCA